MWLPDPRRSRLPGPPERSVDYFAPAPRWQRSLERWFFHLAGLCASVDLVTRMLLLAGALLVVLVGLRPLWALFNGALEIVCRVLHL